MMVKTTGAVLAGGRSERFGSDKRFFKFGDKTLIEIACEKIKNFDEKCLSIDRGFDIKSLPEVAHDFKVIIDKFENKGPLVGIYSTLIEVESEGCVFIPVDMPLIHGELLNYMANFTGYDVIYLKSGDRVYPLPGYYSKRLVALIERNIKSDKLSLMELIFKGEGIKALEISYWDLKKFGEPDRFLLNVNKVDDILGI